MSEPVDAGLLKEQEKADGRSLFIYEENEWHIKIDHSELSKQGTVKAIVSIYRAGDLLSHGSVNLDYLQSRKSLTKDMPDKLRTECDRRLSEICIQLKEILTETKEESQIDSEIPEDVLIEAAELIMKGNHREIIDKAGNALYAGDPTRKLLIHLGYITCSRKGRLHIFVLGASQSGKTYLEHQMAKLLPEDRVVMLNSSSAKAPFYKTKKHGQDFYKGKVVIIDELLDNEALWDVLKAMTSRNQEEARHETVIDGELMELVLKGLPEVQTCAVSMPRGEKGDQINNRFMVTNVDESEEQDAKVRDFEIKKRTTGSEEDRNPKLIILAKAITKILIEKADVDVVIPFCKWIDLKDSRRSELGKFLDLIEACALMNPYQRARIPGSGEIIADFSDYEEAARIWLTNEDYNKKHASDKELKLLSLMAEWQTLEALSERTASEEGKKAGFRKQLGEGSVSNYLSRLRQRDLILSRSIRGDNGDWETRYKATDEIKNLTSELTLTELYLSDSLSCSIPTEEELAKELIAIFEAKLTQKGEEAGDYLSTIDFNSIASSLIQTSSSELVKKLRIDDYANTGAYEKELNSEKSEEVKKLRTTADLSTHFHDLLIIQTIIDDCHKEGKQKYSVYERCNAEGIENYRLKINFLKQQKKVMELDDKLLWAGDRPAFRGRE